MSSNLACFSFEGALNLWFNVPLKSKNIKNIKSCAYLHNKPLPLEMHYHNFYEINIIIGGSGTHYIEKNSFPAQTGDVFCIPPDIAHGYDEDQPNSLKILHILLSPEFMLTYENLLKNINGFSLLFNIEPLIRKNSNIKIFMNISEKQLPYYLNEFNKLIAYCKDNIESGQYEANKTVKILNLISDLSSILIDNTLIKKNDDATNIPELLQILTYIEEHFNEEITLHKLCEISFMSRSSLLKLFNRLCNCSPNEYLLNVRIENACKLLKTTNYSITRIAQDSGFYDSSHFSKLFKRVKKILPKDFRKQVSNRI